MTLEDQMKLYSVIGITILTSISCAAQPNRVEQSPQAPAPETLAKADAPVPKETPAAKDTNPLSTLRSESLSFASITWSSTVDDFDAEFGERISDDVVNPRSRYTCYDGKIGMDPVSVCAQFSSGTVDYLYVVSQSDYGGKEMDDAFADWQSEIESRLGEGQPESFHHRGVSLDWYLADGTKVRLSKEGELRMDFWPKRVVDLGK